MFLRSHFNWNSIFNLIAPRTHQQQHQLETGRYRAHLLRASIPRSQAALIVEEALLRVFNIKKTNVEQ